MEEKVEELEARVQRRSQPAAARATDRFPLALLAIVLVAFCLRVYHAGNHEFTGDDLPNVRIADSIRLSFTEPHLVFASQGHPLLAVYMAHLGSLAFGKSLLGYRLPMVIMGALTCWAIFRLGRDVGGTKAGLWAAALLAVDQFHVTASGTVHCHDVPLVFFGTLALISACRLSRTAPLRTYLAVGLWMGLAYLGKETALMLWPALWLYFLVSAERRAVLRDSRWYLAHAVFAFVVAPDLLWNLAHLTSGGGYLMESVGKATGGALRAHGKALSLFLGEVIMRFDPDALGESYWCWPLRTMHWVAGGLYLGATFWALRWRHAAPVVLLQASFWVTVGIVTWIPGQDMWDPFWWAAMAISPAIVFAGVGIDSWVQSSSRRLWSVALLLCWLLGNTIATLARVEYTAGDCETRFESRPAQAGTLVAQHREAAPRP